MVPLLFESKTMRSALTAPVLVDVDEATQGPARQHHARVPEETVRNIIAAKCPVASGCGPSSS